MKRGLESGGQAGLGSHLILHPHVHTGTQPHGWGGGLAMPWEIRANDVVLPLLLLKLNNAMEKFGGPK